MGMLDRLCRQEGGDRVPRHLCEMPGRGGLSARQLRQNSIAKFANVTAVGDVLTLIKTKDSLGSFESKYGAREASTSFTELSSSMTQYHREFGSRFAVSSPFCVGARIASIIRFIRLSKSPLLMTACC